MSRCRWATDALLAAYHDEEWGVPCHEDRRHFELICLEGAQAGLSWRTVLAKRDAYRAAFCGFDPSVVSRFGESDIDRLVLDAGIIRHRKKLESVVNNAKAFLAVRRECKSFDSYAWAFIGGSPIKNRFSRLEELPAATPLSEAFSADLRRRGFSFVGPTTCYSYLQSAGFVMDHLTTCPRARDLG